MHHFHYRNGVLHAEDVNLKDLAAAIGTPAYVYSTATITRHITAFREAFGARDVDVFYAMKANGNLAVVRTVAATGAGVDVVSEGEIRKALAAGVAGERIVFSGVGKTDDELRFAVATGLYQINVETPGELKRLAAITQEMGRKAPVALRVNPDVGAGGHAKITTGDDSNKFGISFSEALRLYGEGCRQPGLVMRGFAVHIGSQIFDLTEPEQAFRRLAELVRETRKAGYVVSHLDFGGGVGVHYDTDVAGDEGDERLKAYAAMACRVTEGLDVRLGFEPGRVIVANAGVLLTRVVAFNHRTERSFLVVDAGMNDLVRPAMYEAHHDFWPVMEPAGDARRRVYDIVGPICESSDTFALACELPMVEEGALVAIMSAGAYGASMSSTYNLRRLVPEVLVNGRNHAIVRPRQTFEELIGLDRMAPWLAND